MINVIAFLIAVIGICFLFGIVYPILNIIFYPVYKYFGGRMNFKEYMSEI